MDSGPNPQTREGRVVDDAWMEENMPDLNPDWHPDDEAEVEAAPQLFKAKGRMYKGKWLISPDGQEKSIRLFLVSITMQFGVRWMVNSASPAITAEEPLRAPDLPPHHLRLHDCRPRSGSLYLQERAACKLGRGSQQPVRQARLDFHGSHSRLCSSTVHWLRNVGRVHE